MKSPIRLSMYGALCISLVLSSIEAFAQITFPEKSGVIDLGREPYNLDKTGQTDVTEMFQKALSAHPNEWRILYLPNGIYKISKRLKWPAGSASMKRTTLQGESRDGVVLLLADNSPDFQDPKKSQGMILTGMPPAQRFGNEVRDLTFDTGKNNPGAVGLQFMANNQGCVQNVRIRSGDGLGKAGIDFSYAEEIGPLLVKNVEVEGFEYGVLIGKSVNSMTFEHLVVRGQSKAGFRVTGQVASIRGLKSFNKCPALSVGKNAFVTLIDSELTGERGASELAAIELEEEASFYGRNIGTSGYSKALVSQTGAKLNVDGVKIEEYVSHEPLSVFPSPAKSLGLVIKETPEVPWDDPKTWAVITDFGAVSSDRKAPKDVTDAIQKAIDSGATTVCIPNGWFWMKGEVVIRGNVRRIIGCKGRLTRLAEGARWILKDGKEPVVVFERIDSPGIVQASSRTLVVKSGQVRVTAEPGAKGDIFLEDVVSGGFEFNGQNVWARQLNPENPGVKILNNGGNLWILGLKTERGGTLVTTRNGGNSQLDGCFNYSTHVAKVDPMFVIEEGSASFVAAETNNNKNPYYTIVKETRGGVTRYLNRDEAYSRGNAVMLPLYSGWKGPSAASLLAKLLGSEDALLPPEVPLSSGKQENQSDGETR